MSVGMKGKKVDEKAVVKYSKYQELRVPVSCEWANPEGDVCGVCFGDVPTFISHVKGHCDPPSSSARIVCAWKGCDFMSVEHETILQHILFHPFHTFLKLLGSEFQRKFELPICQIDEQYKNLVPPILIPLRCQWNNGQCMAVFESVGDFFLHLRDHVTLLNTGCFICRWKGCVFEGKSKSKLIEHCRSHTGEKVIACPGCGSVFASNAKFKDHLLRQKCIDSSPFLCSICFRTYPSERLLREHVRRHINTMKCPFCDLTCNGPSRLKHHIKFRHNNDMPQQCPVCQKCFKTVHCLSEHLQTHSQKMFKCSITGCKYAGKTLKAWQSHVKKVHMPEQKQYCCHVCGVCFVEGMNLSSHLKESHGYSLPPGHSRFRYITGCDGYKRLQTVRLDADNIAISE